MYTDKIEKEKISSYFESVPKRSLSYNDLKKKRLIRSEKSKTKLKPDSSERLIVRTEKKKVPEQFSIGISTTSNTPHDMKKIERSINDLKNVFDEMKEKSKKYMISKPFYTDRNLENKKISFINKSIVKNEKISSLYESVDLAGNEKELIKRIIEKKKSQRRLLKFDEIRAEVKKSKSKSKLKLLEDSTSPNSNIINSLSQEKPERSISKKNVRINKFETVKEREKTFSITERPSNTEVVQINPTVEISNKESLGLKSQYRSRRKLKIDGFQTERREIQKKENGAESELKVKFHRKLRKTNSEIVIKTKEIIYDKNKYMNKVENKSIIIKSAEKQYFSNEKNHEENKELKKEEEKQNFNTENLNEKKNAEVCINDDGHEFNLMKVLELSAINISSIEIRKEQSLNDIENELNILQVIEAQELELEMKKAKSTSLESQDKKFKKVLKTTKESNKKHEISTCQIENAENLENLSNILDFIALPTKELKVKINRCSTKVGKKKNELEKFKKIFPMNFFNN